MFVGCAFALSAKGKEMLTTMTLGLVLCAMTGVAALVWVSTGQAVILGMLPWYVADWLAIVSGGAIVRTRRLAATTRPSMA
jgi:hypothetical protein